MQSQIITLTPEKASILLKQNGNNRRINLDHVDFLAKEMKSGKWKLNGQSIVVSRKGELLDGQHRLMAIVKSGQSIESILCEDAEESIMATIDTGRSRNAADVFSMNHVTNANAKAALAKNLYMWNLERTHIDHGGIKGSMKPSNRKIYDVYSTDIQNIELALNRSEKKLIQLANKGNMAFAIYLLLEKYSIALVDEFLEYVRDGGDYSKSPSHYLPRFISSRKQGDIALHRKEDFYVLLYCFKKWVNKETIQAIKVKSIYKNADDYYNFFELPKRVKIACL